MSRIGKNPVALPAGVEVKVDDNHVITVKGPLGQLQEQLSADINIEVKDNEVVFTRNSDHRSHREQHGLVGYKVEKKGKDLVMNLGYSHPVVMTDPDGIETIAEDVTTVVVKGIDKGLVGNYSAKIRAWREPEPYKGKGIRYDDEVIRRKEGKTGSK